MKKSCPVCGKLFDPLTSPYICIDEDKILTFCSEKCKIQSSQPRFILNIRKSIYIYTSIFPKKSLIIIPILIFIIISTYFFHQHSIITEIKLFSVQNFKVNQLLYVRQNSKIASTKVYADFRTDPIALHNKIIQIMNTSLNVQNPNLWDFLSLKILAINGNKKALQQLKTIFKRSKNSSKQKIAEILTELGEKEGLDFLRSKLTSRKKSDSITVALSLGKLGDRKSLYFLTKLMKLSQTKIAAAEVAVTMQNKVAFIILKKMMKTAKREGDRIRAALALSKIQDPETEKFLLDALNKSQFGYMIALGLSMYKNPKAIPILKEALNHIPLRTEAAQRLAILGQNESYKLLLNDLTSDYRPAQLTAAISIYILTKNLKTAFLYSSPIKFLKIEDFFQKIYLI